MSVRKAERPLTGKPATSFDVYVGETPDGIRQATLWANKYRANAIPLRDADVVRELIRDLGVVLEHLEPSPPPADPETLGEWCGLCKECCPDDLNDAPEKPCGRVHECDLCERKR
ncbi:hypothetical protein SEA_CARON_45 [Microbacterium phage Caron]|uniref:Uncharacterized protein n=1 Tax=Microbacterium phage Caron TaxID=3028494 RepID=A0AAF0CLI8_9CAUD|nr:hypothetical protein SEA_CARON_45 [Microbacterium phage Caron]